MWERNNLQIGGMSKEFPERAQSSLVRAEFLITVAGRKTNKQTTTAQAHWCCPSSLLLAYMITHI